MADLSFGKIIALAGADAVNPCALAVLVLILIMVATISSKKREVLKAGFAFSLAVFIFYFFYGLILVGFFKTLTLALASFRIYVYKAFAVFAVILGLLNIRDSIWYKPGGFMTEMPLSLRPKMKRLVKNVKSPKGAFFIGIFVTLFLLPCTIGPYIVASGILSAVDFVRVALWLLLYNLIFISPMVLITLIIFFGFTTIEKVGYWKDKNIRYLHLIAGLILFLVGIAMLFGII